MSAHSIGLEDHLQTYLVHMGVREHDVLQRCRLETAQRDDANMQISQEQGQFLRILVELLGPHRIVEVGTFTGYSSLAMALSLPIEGSLICCDICPEKTSHARRYWHQAGVEHRIDLRLGDAINTLDQMLSSGHAGTIDLMFVDADKESYSAYIDRAFPLLRTNGLLLLDNVLWSGAVIDDADQEPATRGIRAANLALAHDERFTVSMIPLGDGLTLARKR